MTYEPPFLPAGRSDDESMRGRVARARKLRADAAARVEERFADLRPREGEWCSGDRHDLEMERLSVL